MEIYPTRGSSTYNNLFVVVSSQRHEGSGEGWSPCVTVLSWLLVGGSLRLLELARHQRWGKGCSPLGNAKWETTITISTTRGRCVEVLDWFSKEPNIFHFLYTTTTIIKSFGHIYGLMSLYYIHTYICIN